MRKSSYCSLLLALFLLAAPLTAGEVRLSVESSFVSAAATPLIEGYATVPTGTEVTITVTGESLAAPQIENVGVDSRGRFTVIWPHELAAGLYEVETRVAFEDAEVVKKSVLLVQPDGRLPRRPLITIPYDYAVPYQPHPEDFLEFTDRWRIAIPGARELRRFDPYNQNKWKGDFPIRGEDIFLVLLARSDTLTDFHEVPIPSGISTARPGSSSFFGESDVLAVQQNFFLSTDLYKGSTAFKPFDWRFKATVSANVNHLDVRENAAVNPDVRRGADRTDTYLGIQELFFEYKIKDLSANYDFLSVRAGIQPFNSDFRGFLFTDFNLGVRLFGNYASNRYQFNLAYFDRLEKDTNSVLNTLKFRDQQVFVANFYFQDFFTLGYTAQWSIHHLQDDATFLIDKNGFLARPDPVGSAMPHEITATYLGWTGFGKFDRINVNHALYYAFGEDSLNPIAGVDIFGGGREDVDISAFMAALELSMDRDWYRPRVSVFYSSGDDNPTDRDAEGFSAIFENPNFVGGGFSFWNRLGIRLAGTGVSLINRGSLIPDLRSNKEEGQSNFVNPGIRILNVGVDVEVSPEIKAIFNVSHLSFDQTETLELLTFQSDIDRDIGLDLSAGIRYRPFFNNNFILLGGVAALVPGEGFEDIYEDDDTRFAVFGNLILTF